MIEDPSAPLSPDATGPSPADKALYARVDEAVRTLSEYFDAVQIFASHGSAGLTKRYVKGKGDYYARYGLTKMWVLNEEGEEWSFKVK